MTTNSTNFVNFETVIYADWLNDVNKVVYNGQFVATSITIPTLSATSINSYAISSPAISVTNLTAGQVPFAGLGGLLQSNSNLTFDGSTLTTYNLTVNNTLTLASLVLGSPLSVSSGGTGANTLTGYVKGNGTSAMAAMTQIPNSDVSGLGTMSTQNASAVAITGGTITGVTITLDSINSTPIGASSPSTGAFTSLIATSISGVGFSNYLASPPAIGSGAANTGAFTSLSVSGLASLSSVGTSNAIISGGTINGASIGASSASTGKFTILTATTGIGGGTF